MINLKDKIIIHYKKENTHIHTHREISQNRRADEVMHLKRKQSFVAISMSKKLNFDKH